MGTTSDRVLGAGLVAFSGAVFAYYSVWVLVLPFVDPTHPFHNYFPPAEWAIRGPVLLLVLGVGGVGALVSCVLIRSAGGKRRSSSGGGDKAKTS